MSSTSQRPSPTKLRRLLADSAGFTIQELIVGLIVGSILVGYAFEVYAFAQRMVTHWRKQADLTEVVHSTLNRVTLDLQRAEEMEHQGDSVWVVRTDSRVIALYRLSGGAIVRNDVRMNDPAVASLSIRTERTGHLISVELRGRSGLKEETATVRVLLQTSSAGKFARSGFVGRSVP